MLVVALASPQFLQSFAIWDDGLLVTLASSSPAGALPTSGGCFLPEPFSLLLHLLHVYTLACPEDNLKDNPKDNLQDSPEDKMELIFRTRPRTLIQDIWSGHLGRTYRRTFRQNVWSGYLSERWAGHIEGHTEGHPSGQP